MSDRALSQAVYLLQNATTPLDERVEALRFVKRYVDTSGDVDAYHKKRLNQLVLNNVLKIVLKEDGSANLRKRQLIRTEMFIILAKLMNSNTLFGGIKDNTELWTSEAIRSDNMNSYLEMAPSPGSPFAAGSRSRLNCNSFGTSADSEDYVYDSDEDTYVPRKHKDARQILLAQKLSGTVDGRALSSPKSGGSFSPQRKKLPPAGTNKNVVGKSKRGGSPDRKVLSHSMVMMPNHSSSPGGEDNPRQQPPPPAFGQPIAGRTRRIAMIQPSHAGHPSDGTAAAGSRIAMSRSLSSLAIKNAADGSHHHRAEEELPLLRTVLLNSTSDAKRLMQSSSSKTPMFERKRPNRQAWQPRPSVLFNSAIAFDGIAPGTDPFNYIEQDRKLGYQKPRVWFPSAKIDLTANLVPDARSSITDGREKSVSERIVEEYSQMRALISFVGDVVAPFTQARPAHVKPSSISSIAGIDDKIGLYKSFVSFKGKDGSHSSPTSSFSAVGGGGRDVGERGNVGNLRRGKKNTLLLDSISASRTLTAINNNDNLAASAASTTGNNIHPSSSQPFPRLSGVTDSKKFYQTMSEAMKIWSPLLGTHLPTWARAEDSLLGRQMKRERKRLRAFSLDVQREGTARSGSVIVSANNSESKRVAGGGAHIVGTEHSFERTYGIKILDIKPRVGKSRSSNRKRRRRIKAKRISAIDGALTDQSSESGLNSNRFVHKHIKSKRKAATLSLGRLQQGKHNGAVTGSGAKVQNNRGMLDRAMTWSQQRLDGVALSAFGSESGYQSGIGDENASTNTDEISSSSGTGSSSSGSSGSGSDSETVAEELVRDDEGSVDSKGRSMDSRGEKRGKVTKSKGKSTTQIELDGPAEQSEDVPESSVRDAVVLEDGEVQKEKRKNERRRAKRRLRRQNRRDAAQRQREREAQGCEYIESLSTGSTGKGMMACAPAGSPMMQRGEFDQEMPYSLQYRIRPKRDILAMLGHSMPAVVDNPNRLTGLPSTSAQVSTYQQQVALSLDLQMMGAEYEISAAKSQIESIMAKQYALLPPRFMLILEGAKANSRRLITNALLIFCRVKRYNLISLAFGTWKISLVDLRSRARRPQYAKIAACYIMSTWVITMRLKNLRSWIAKWRRGTMLLIFVERQRSAAIIQSICRRWRDRTKFLSMHWIGGAYNGVLSDVYLAPERNPLRVKYRIPIEIRLSRRMYWQAAVIIQTAYRCWIESREYFYQRRMVVLIQSMGRMWPVYCWFRRLKATTIRCQALARRTVKRRQYRRLRSSTIIVQAYVRRYLRQLLFWRKMNAEIWRPGEAEFAAVILIQCRWRIVRAKRRVESFRFRVKMREYSALVIQRNYYRSRKAFHTFFLMCAYRMREIEDKKIDALGVKMGRYYCARVIQRHYKQRYFVRIISSVVRVQCWYRGRMGYLRVKRLRLEKWAKRKLHHWARGRFIKRRNILARKLQRWWWRLRNGRLLRHLWYKLYCRDREEELLLAENFYHAAMRIQAQVKGIWTRRWVKRYKAATKIQRSARAHLTRKYVRSWKRERILRMVRKLINSVTERAVKDRTVLLVRQHEKMLRLPQALIRGFLTRQLLAAQRAYVDRRRAAAICIQRSWRHARARAKAYNEWMAVRRMVGNPFRECSTLHDVLQIARVHTRMLYSRVDVRVGMKTSTFLHRLGYPELTDMFPKKEFAFALSLNKLSLEEMVRMFEHWRDRVEMVKQAKNKDKNKNKNKAQPKRRVRPPPISSLQHILEVVSVPIFPRIPHDLALVNQIQVFPEYTSPERLENVIKVNFAKKFGKHLNIRANNLAREVIDMMWAKYNNFRVFGESVCTKAQLLKAIAIASESSNVMSFLSEVRARSSVTAALEEARWDAERVAKCADLMELAVDQLKMLAPAHGMLMEMIDGALESAAFCRKRLRFLRKKLNDGESVRIVAGRGAGKNGERGEKAKLTRRPTERAVLVTGAEGPSSNININNSTTDGDTKVAPAGAGEGDVVGGVSSAISGGKYRQIMTVSDSLRLAFSGSIEDLILEEHVSLCKIYSEVIDRLSLVTLGVQSIKNSWKNKAIRRAIVSERLKIFLDTAMRNYLSDVNENKVHKVWNKIRKQAAIAQKVTILLNAIKDRRSGIEIRLRGICRYGWDQYEDQYGYPYWMPDPILAKIAAKKKKSGRGRGLGRGRHAAAVFSDDVTVSGVDDDAINNNSNNSDAGSNSVKTGMDSAAMATAGYAEDFSSATYEMPIYIYAEWKSAEVIQRVGRNYLERSWQRRLARERKLKADIAEAEARHQAELEKGRRAVELTLSILSYPVKPVAVPAPVPVPLAATAAVVQTGVSAAGLSTVRVKKNAAGMKKPPIGRTDPAPAAGAGTGAVTGMGKNEKRNLKPKPATNPYLANLPNLESFLPWKYQFEAHPKLVTGTWALLPRRIAVAAGAVTEKGASLSGAGFSGDSLDAEAAAANSWQSLSAGATSSSYANTNASDNNSANSNVMNGSYRSNALLVPYNTATSATSAATGAIGAFEIEDAYEVVVIYKLRQKNVPATSISTATTSTTAAITAAVTVGGESGGASTGAGVTSGREPTSGAVTGRSDAATGLITARSGVASSVSTPGIGAARAGAVIRAEMGARRYDPTNSQGPSGALRGMVCDARTVKGRRIKNIDMTLLRQMNFEAETAVETRFQGRRHFYRSFISKRFYKPGDLYPYYCVTYEDGEFETNLQRDVIRPSAVALREFLAARRELLPPLRERYKRLRFYAELRFERVQKRVLELSLELAERKAKAEALQAAQRAKDAAAAAVTAKNKNSKNSKNKNKDNAAGTAENNSSIGSTLAAESVDSALESHSHSHKGTYSPSRSQSHYHSEDSGGERREEEEEYLQEQSHSFSFDGSEHESGAMGAEIRSRRSEFGMSSQGSQSRSQAGSAAELDLMELQQPLQQQQQQQQQHQHRLQRGRGEGESEDGAFFMPLLRYDLSSRIRYCRAPLRRGWDVRVVPPTVVTESADEDEYSSALSLYSTANATGGGGEEEGDATQRQRQRGLGLGLNEREKIIYVNDETQEAMLEIPTYSAAEALLAQKIQLNWFVQRAKRAMLRKVHSISLSYVVEEAIARGCRIGFIGYRLEGVSPMQILRRAGYWEVADIIEQHYRLEKLNLNALTIDAIVAKQKSDFESIGILQMHHVKHLKEFQTWWKRTTIKQRESKLSLLNYYPDPPSPEESPPLSNSSASYDQADGPFFSEWLDRRSIVECIQDSEEALFAKFSKVITTGATRTRSACKTVVMDSVFPHAHQQIETYLKRFADKPEMARDSVYELINKPTTHTWVEERQVLQIYQRAVQVIRGVVARLKLTRIRKKIVRAQRRVDEVLQLVPKQQQQQQQRSSGGAELAGGGTRPLHSGPEARAALIFRRDVLEYIATILRAVVTMQRHVRGHIIHSKIKRLIVDRRNAVDIFQRAGRRYLAYKAAALCRWEQASEWEQLWDERRELLYYYNYVTKRSQYEEPEVPFRPLVRDLCTARLIQAWPEIDNRRGETAYLPPTTTTVTTIAASTLCGICNVRKFVRVCQDCDDEWTQDPRKSYNFPYCFPCYMREHTAEKEKIGHRFYTIEAASSSNTSTTQSGEEDHQHKGEMAVLMCCMCDERAATRKCMGMLDEKRINQIMQTLKKAHADRWKDLLVAANVGGERKVQMMLDQVIDSDTVYDSAGALASAKLQAESVAAVGKAGGAGTTSAALTAFSSTNSAGDAGGMGRSASLIDAASAESKRSLGAAVIAESRAQALITSQLQSIRSQLERTRAECDDCYCQGCYEEVHSGGKRAAHRWKGFQEFAPVCVICSNDAAERNCLECESLYCESCFKVFHAMGRKRKHKFVLVMESLNLQRSAEQQSGRQSPSGAGRKMIPCDVCKRRIAEVKCPQERCKVRTCDSCFQFDHCLNCEKDPANWANKNSKNTDPSAAFLCVNCAEPATQRCIQCKDLYCTVNGCFSLYHSKGNRINHGTEPIKPPRATTTTAAAAGVVVGGGGGTSASRSNVHPRGVGSRSKKMSLR